MITNSQSALDLRDFAAVLFDLDGTIWHEHLPLPGAVALVQRLQECDHPHGFVSNSSASPARVVRRLADMGLNVTEQTILTAAAAACDYVLDTFDPGVRVFNIANPSIDELLSGRVTLMDDECKDCDAVLASGLAHGCATPVRLQKALQLLMRGASLIGLCADRAYPTPRGFEIGAGGVTAMLAYAADVPATYCGKPEPWFFENICHRLQVPPDRCLLIGDNLEADIAGAHRVGMTTILTLTGLATPEAVAKATDKPDAVVNDLSELLF
jgi:HAD superfamily hydrolase (TIGR01450 family)